MITHLTINRLISLHLLPLMYFYELQDIQFFIKNLQQPSNSFLILNYISFSHTTTRASANFKLIHTRSMSNINHHFYFNRLPRLWNSLPPINPYSSLLSIKLTIKDILWKNFSLKFDSLNPCSYCFKCPCPKCQ